MNASKKVKPRILPTRCKEAELKRIVKNAKEAAKKMRKEIKQTAGKGPSANKAGAMKRK